MKKILFITNIPVPYRIDFYNELGKHFDLTVIFEAKGASDQGIKFNWNIDKISNFRAIFLSQGDIKEKKIDWSIFKYLKEKYDEIIVTNYSYFTEMIAIIYLKILHIPYYMETDGGVIRKENLIKKLYKKFLISGAKGYFSPSEMSDKYLSFYGAKDNLIYRYSFTSMHQSAILNRELTMSQKRHYKKKLNISEKIMILGVGQFIHRKGWDVLLNSSKNFDNNLGVYIVGSEPIEEYVTIKNKLGKENIHFEGFKNSDELREYYMAADLFVLPTREDIWGLVINEAMSYGLPIITTDHCVAGLELVKDRENGFVIGVDDVSRLSECILTLVHDDKLRQSMGYNSLNKIRNYTIENMALEHKKILSN